MDSNPKANVAFNFRGKYYIYIISPKDAQR